MSTEPLPACHKDEHPVSTAVAPPSPEALDQAAAIFRALGDGNRLRILILLGHGERCVSEIAAALDDNISAVSQRLKLLRFERIVHTRRQGKHIYYRLADAHIKALIDNAIEHAAEI